MTKLMGIDGAWDVPTEYEIGNYVKVISPDADTPLGSVGRIIDECEDYVEVAFTDGPHETFDRDELLLVSPATYSSLSGYAQAAGKPYESINTSSPAVMDNVTRPEHYKAGMPEGIEVIDIIKSQGADYLHGSVIKYILRWKFKNGSEDLKKAQVFLGWLIEQEEGKK